MAGKRSEHSSTESQVQREPHYRDIVEGSLQGIIVQQDERILYANAAMAKLFAYASPGDMIGLNPFEDLIDAEDLSEFRARTAAVYRDESVLPHPGWKAKRRDQKAVWIASAAHRTEWQGRPAVASFYFDITDRQNAELHVRESERRYRAALVAGRMGAWETDLIGKTRTWTPEGMALFGLSLLDGIGHVGGDFDEYVKAIHPDDRHLVASFYERANTVDGFSAEYRIVRSDNQIVWLSGRGQVISRTFEGKPQRLISIMADISDRKDSEQRVEMLMRELAHRSTNLMTVVQSISFILGRNSTSVKEFLSQFAMRLQALGTLHRVLARQSWTTASLKDLVYEQLQPFVVDNSLMLDLVGPQIFLPAEAAQMISLAIHELATNSLKHGAWSAPNGKILVDWRMESANNEPPRLVLTWSELGGPSAAASTRKGFGHVVLYELVPQSLHGSTTSEFLAEGFRWVLSIPGSAFHTAIGNST
jgi:PAS domain S-box-containing protein